ncbi:MAG: TIGR02206 family membrane protein [Solirubrobacterales bacterium]|nr:TIGR02206 family membrane protein [Solirubrobacterales bacterium]
MRQFSIAHLAALLTLVLGSSLAIIAPRRLPGRWMTWASWALAGAIFAGWAGEYIAETMLGTWTLQSSLPLQLTDAVSLAAIIALLTRRRLFVELVYFWSLSASLQAVLTPDLGYSFPSVFYFTYFFYHVGSIIAACLLVFGCRLYPRPSAIWRVYTLTLAFAALSGLGDVITGGNYMYLRSKPIHNSLLNLMGAWPVYILSGAALGLAMFAVLNAIAVAVSQRDRSHADRRAGGPTRGAKTGQSRSCPLDSPAGPNGHRIRLRR